MENTEVKQISDKRFEIIPKGSKEKDLLAPWFKMSKNFDMTDPTETLFSRYIVFYLNVITAGNDEGFINSSLIFVIGKEMKIETKSIEKCLKELVRLNMLFKVKNGLYQINQKHLNKKMNVKDSNAIIKSQKQNTVVNGNIIINHNNVQINNKTLNDI